MSIESCWLRLSTADPCPPLKWSDACLFSQVQLWAEIWYKTERKKNVTSIYSVIMKHGSFHLPECSVGITCRSSSDTSSAVYSELITQSCQIKPVSWQDTSALWFCPFSCSREICWLPSDPSNSIPSIQQHNKLSCWWTRTLCVPDIITVWFVCMQILSVGFPPLVSAVKNT